MAADVSRTESQQNEGERRRRALRRGGKLAVILVLLTEANHFAI